MVCKKGMGSTHPLLRSRRAVMLYKVYGLNVLFVLKGWHLPWCLHNVIHDEHAVTNINLNLFQISVIAIQTELIPHLMKMVHGHLEEIAGMEQTSFTLPSHTWGLDLIGNDNTSRRCDNPHVYIHIFMLITKHRYSEVLG